MVPSFGLMRVAPRMLEPVLVAAQRTCLLRRLRLPGRLLVLAEEVELRVVSVHLVREICYLRRLVLLLLPFLWLRLRGTCIHLGLAGVNASPYILTFHSPFR